MDRKEERFYHLKFILFLLCLAAVVVCILVFDHFTYRLPLYNGSDSYQESDWIFGEKGGPMKKTELNEKHLIENGKTYLLSTTLTYTGEGDQYPSALLTVGNYEVRVFLDGKLMFQYTRAERGFPRIKSMGGAAFFIPLGENCQGRELVIELNTSMDYAQERRMPGVTFGDYAAHMERLYFSNFPSMLISMAIFFVAVVLVILGNGSTRKRWAYLFFALFALVIVVYRCSQDLFLMYMWANPITTITLEMFSLAACPLPVVLSYRHEMKPYFEKSFTALILLCILNLAGQLLLHFTGIRDVVENLEISHLCIVISAVSLVIMGMLVHKKDPTIHCMRKLVPILLGGAIDFAVFYVRVHTIGPGSFFVIGNFIGLGVLASLSMLVWEARKERENAFAERQRSILLEKLAYVDALTGIENRAAFTREIAEIQAGIHAEDQVLMVEADLNDLKKTNDNLGHAAGDKLIQQAAQLLKDIFGGYGRVFRTGGDEFFAILYNVPQQQWEQLQGQLDAELKKRSREGTLSLAVGHAYQEGTVEQCVQLADKRMYQNKTAIKASSDYGFSDR